ncbi:hypothetical protein QF023_002876 [Chryseobacterium sp. SLBN-27]|uniref:hypothetical protein n=1 Tax=Chryseobacterium sp. SLBN-27 TaxID=3042287 RepID=UPI002854EAA1|nr:hypothetical protein [Chryseobacterium sp. SLBN-27]MDR6159360.1 hypothetical protein [Chryseobacterium sp. SLBN-27]
MKNKILIQLFLLLFAFTITKANVIPNINPHDKEYFRSFKKNEQPENKKFNIINECTNKNAAFYYVIYKENSLGEGFYFKIVFDKNEKPIATYYATENDKALNVSTVENLKKILGGQSELSNSLEQTPAECVIKCHRTNGCYSKETTLGVFLCSADCQASCA